MFYDALNTFHSRLYGVTYIMVKDHSARERKPAAATCAAFSGQVRSGQSV